MCVCVFVCVCVCVCVCVARCVCGQVCVWGAELNSPTQQLHSLELHGEWDRVLFCGDLC